MKNPPDSADTEAKRRTAMRRSYSEQLVTEVRRLRDVGGTVKQSEGRALEEESNQWVRALYAIADPVFFLLCVVVGFMMIFQAPWIGGPFIASGAVLAYRVAHRKRSPWL